MRYLTPKHWEVFHKPDGRFDGVKFERVVAALLPELYPGQWHATQYSWDGKKDFYQKVGSERIWAECKAYKDPISINVVSPTLIMAIIENVQVILLFSYSPVNDNAKWYLGQFATVSSRTIRIYDDEALERLILASPGARRFFPSASTSVPTPEKKIRAHARVSKDPDIDYHMDATLDCEKLEVALTLLSTFSLDVLIQNLGDSPTTVVLSLDRTSLINDFWLFNQELTGDPLRVKLQIEPSSSGFYRFYLRPRQCGTLSPPVVHVQSNESEITLRLEGINVSSVLAVPLIGSKQHAALHSFRHLVSVRDKPTFVHLFGGSGTGKTRLMREFRDELLGRGFAVFAFNGENERNSAFDVFVRRLVSKVARLPMLDRVIRPTETDAPVGFDPTVYDLLYRPSFRPSDNLALSLKVVTDVLRAHKIAVLIDNLQYFDKDTVALINECISVTIDTPSRNVWILGINTDVLTEDMPAAALSGRLKAFAAEYSDTAMSVEVTGFSREDARHYLNEALAGDITEIEHEPFTVSHPETADLIINRVGTRPLYLEEALHHAVDQKAVGLVAGRMLVRDIEQFHVAIRGLPKKIRTLIDSRWKYIQPYLEPGAVLLVQVLARLICIPMPLAARLSIPSNAIRVLNEAGIIDISESNEISFHHNLQFLYFSDTYARITPAFAHELLVALESSDYVSTYPFQRAQLEDVLGQFSQARVVEVASLVLSGRCSGLGFQRAVPFLIEVFNRPMPGVSPEVELNVVRSLCQELKHHETLTKAAGAFAHALQLRSSRMNRYVSDGEAYYTFLHDHVNAFFAIHRDAEVLRLIETGIVTINEFTFANPNARLAAIGNLWNRRGVATKTVNDLTEAERSIRKSMLIAEELKAPSLIFKNFVDWGYIYHGFANRNPELTEKWHAAIEVFDRNALSHPDLEEKRPSMLLHRATLEILSDRRSDAIHTIEEGIRCSRRKLSPFHEVKLLILRVVAEVAWAASRYDKSLMHWVDAAEDRAVTTCAQRSYWLVFYMRAKLHRMAGDYSKATANFLVALEQLSRILCDSRMESRYEPFFEDLAIHLRESKAQLLEDYLRRVQDGRIRGRMRLILGMTNSDFEGWVHAYLPTATFHDGRFNLPVP